MRNFILCIWHFEINKKTFQWWEDRRHQTVSEKRGRGQWNKETVDEQYIMRTFFGEIGNNLFAKLLVFLRKITSLINDAICYVKGLCLSLTGTFAHHTLRENYYVINQSLWCGDSYSIDSCTNRKNWLLSSSTTRIKTYFSCQKTVQTQNKFAFVAYSYFQYEQM